MPTQENRPRVTERRRRRYNPLPFILVCAAMIIFISFLFRVSTIEVTGSTMYTDEEIISASGIQVGDNLFFINRSSAASGILSKLPAVDNALVERVLPNKITINITESDSIAYTNISGELWSLDHSLRFLERIDAPSSGMIELRGIECESPIIGTQVDSTNAEQISTALEKMGSYGMLPYITWLELLGDGNIEFDYIDRFTVRMPLSGDVDYNLQKLLSAVGQLSPGDRALLDLTIDDKVHFIPR